MAKARTATPSAPPSPLQQDVREDRSRQLSVLIRRYAAVMWADKLATVILLAQAPFFDLLFNLLYSFLNKMSTDQAEESTILLWLMILGATWIGTSNAIREVVKEWPILKREHALGMSLAAYAASKVILLSVLTSLECGLLAVATMAWQKLPAKDPIMHNAFPNGGVFFSPIMVEVTIDVVLAGLGAMAVALLVSAVVQTSDQANFAMPLLLVAQVVFSAPILGGASDFYNAVGMLSTAQWGMAATASTLDMNDVREPFLTVIVQQKADAGKQLLPGQHALLTSADKKTIDGRPYWEHNRQTWLLDIFALIGLTAFSIFMTYASLVRKLRMKRSKAPPVQVARAYAR